MVIACYILLVISFAYGLYYGLTGLFAFIKSPKKSKPSDSEKQNRFAVIIAARNEEQVIGQLIDSLNKQHYDRSLFTIFTAVNHCTDDTEAIARNFGSEIISCPDSVASKGDVLKFAFASLRKRDDIDAYVVFDADNLVHPDFLRQMNHAINNGTQVAQGKRDCKNLSDNWISASYALFYYMQNFFLNRARRNIGGSATINGTGFMITKKALDFTGFDTHSITEDVEYTGICAVKGVRIDYVEDAVTYDEQPTRFCVSFRQRKRWSIGNLQCWTSYVLQLISTFFKTGRLACVDILFNYSAPFMQLLGLAPSVLLALAPILSIELDPLLISFISYGWIISGLSYIFGLALCAIILKINGHSPAETPSGILFFSLFLFSWVLVNCAALFHRKNTWHPIEHSRNINIDTLLK